MVAIAGLILVVMLDPSNEESKKILPIDLAQVKQNNAFFDQSDPQKKQTISQVDLPVVTDISQQSFTFYPELTRIKMLEDEALVNGEFISRIEFLLTTGDAVIRLAAVESIVAINHPISISALVDALGDPEPVIRIAAIEGLAMQSGGNISMYVESMLFDPDKAVKIVAINALADLENVEAVPALASLLSDHDPSIRSRAVNALDEIGGELADSYISQVNNDSNQIDY